MIYAEICDSQFAGDPVSDFSWGTWYLARRGDVCRLGLGHSTVWKSGYHRTIGYLPGQDTFLEILLLMVHLQDFQRFPTSKIALVAA